MKTPVIISGEMGAGKSARAEALARLRENGYCSWVEVRLALKPFDFSSLIMFDQPPPLPRVRQ